MASLPLYAPEERFSLWDAFPNLYANHVALSGDAGWDTSLEFLPRLLPSLAFAAMWFSVRHFGKRILFPSLAKSLGVRGRTRVSKFAYQLWLTIFYAGSSVVGYYIIKDEEYAQFPVSARGGAALFNRPEQTISAKIEWYYWYQIGFYIAELFAIFLEPKRKDFFEYFLHHVVTLGLLSGSFVTRFHRIGLYINFIHDIPDIFLCAAKVCHYAKGPEVVVNGFFAFFVSSFIFFRLYCLPHLTWADLCIVPYVRRASYPFYILTAMFGGILQALHLFWFYLIVRMIIRLLMGVQGDMRSDESGDDAAGGGTAEQIAGRKAARVAAHKKAHDASKSSKFN